MDGKKAWKKTGFGILFVAACFVSMYILMEFHDNLLLVLLTAVLLLATAFCFLYEIFSDKTKSRAPEEESAVYKEPVSGGNDGEFHLKITKHMKEMESTQKELISVLKNQNVLLQSNMENLQEAIIILSEKQANQTKSVIKFNKENARQLAISERETLEYVMMELKKTIEDNIAGVAPVRTEEAEKIPVPEMPVFEEEPIAELEEVAEEELLEVYDLPGDDEYIIPEMPIMEEAPVEEAPVEEALVEDISVEEMVAMEEPEPVADPLAGIGGDPNAMMSADDIAKLFAMQNADEPAEEEPVAEEPEAEELDLSALFEDIAEGALEDAVEELTEEPIEESVPAVEPLADIGGDPNAMMTPEDIAKLLASMGQ